MKLTLPLSVLMGEGIEIVMLSLQPIDHSLCTLVMSAVLKMAKSMLLASMETMVFMNQKFLRYHEILDQIMLCIARIAKKAEYFQKILIELQKKLVQLQKKLVQLQQKLIELQK